MPRLEDIPPEVVADAVAKAVVEAVSQGGDAEAVVAGALARVKGDLLLEGCTGAAPMASGPSLRLPVHTQPPLREAPPPSGRPAPRGTPNGHHPAPMGSGKSVGARNGAGLLTEADVLAALRDGQREIRVAPGTIVTALARDSASDAGIALVEA